MGSAMFSGLDLLATAVVVLDRSLAIVHMNPAAETLFALSLRNLRGQPFAALFADGALHAGRLAQALADTRGFVDPDLVLARPGRDALHLNCVVTPVDAPEAALLIEFRHIEQQLRIEREAQRVTQLEANRELIRNLAHEIRNPLGGLRGSAQLLERELDRADLREYTQVSIKEADRLQALMDRLLTPNRPPLDDVVNIHEVCERVRSLILAEFPRGIRIERDYDSSLPELRGDREQLIQAVLNIVRNAAQALLAEPRAPDEEGVIELRTRVARQVTLAKARHKLALELQVIDNGPGISAAIRDRIFYPLVSGREGGSGLGLTLTQTYVQHHGGVIEVESQPGRTAFRMVLPLP
ncbi:MAG: PAS domain-containing protein [Betaproteobacteria bacterium]|nr:PAS domain-containing protein [Betaproteobacteria bacterium]